MPMREEMDDMDRKILNNIQEEFPLAERPYAVIGAAVGLDEDEVFARVKRLKESGLIRRIGPVLERKKLGYTSVLCGISVEDRRIVEIAGAISEETGVTHNYERDGELNLWFTVTKKTQAEIDDFLSEIERRFNLIIYRFPEKRVFKIKTVFPV